MNDLTEAPQVELKNLSPKHKQVAALVAQGVERRIIAQACDYVPEYITWLQRQPLFVEYVKGMNEAVAVRLEAMFDQSVGVIAAAMQNGNVDEQLKGAKLQLEATGRIGRYQTPAREQGGEDKLEVLADRLVFLLKRQKGDTHETEDAEILSEQETRVSQGSGRGSQRALQGS